MNAPFIPRSTRLAGVGSILRVTPDLTEGIKWYLAFLFSTTAHEAAHAWTAFKLGDDTAQRGGQVTLDPTPHLKREPIGMVVVPIVSYLLGGWMVGWASAPFNPQWAMQYPRRAAAMSLAGPVSNLLIVLAAAIAIRIGIAAGYFESPMSITFSQVVEAHTSTGYFIASFLSIFFSLNLLLCTFNLLPFPPLDGSGVLMFFVSPETAENFMRFMQHPMLRIIGLFIAWKLFGYVFPATQLFAVNLLYPGANYQ
jgi:Zn-dependent protease